LPPRYLELAETLRADIAGQRLKPGAAMPTEAQLTERFAVSRFTVREALRRLEAEGLIARRRGSGTVVAPQVAPVRRALSDAAALLQYAQSSTFVIGRVRPVTLSRADARLLGREEGERWLHVRGLRAMDGEEDPIALTDAWLHPRFGGVVPRLVSGHEALFAQLQRLSGLTLSRVRQDIRAVKAGPTEADALSVPRGTACLMILRHYFDEQDALFEMSCSVHPGHRFSYIVET
jgi:DNA-binding GntR family transcriptional regulator